MQLFSFFYIGARWGGWSSPRVGRFTPGKDPVPIVQEAGWAPGPVWTGAENLAPHWDSIPGSSSLQRVAVPTELSRPTYFPWYKLNISFNSSRLVFLMETGCFLCKVVAQVLRVMSLLYGFQCSIVIQTSGRCRQEIPDNTASIQQKTAVLKENVVTTFPSNYPEGPGSMPSLSLWDLWRTGR